jgi:hypothetical protein
MIEKCAPYKSQRKPQQRPQPQMPTLPKCRSLGKHCRELTVTIRISDAEAESRTLQDHSVTWVTGHTERITFGTAYRADGELRVDATVHIACRYLRAPHGGPAIRPDGTLVPSRNGSRPEVRCALHGFSGDVPRCTRLHDTSRDRCRTENGEFVVYFKGKRRTLALRLKRSAKRRRPKPQAHNPCATAPCYTSDHTRGAACCRDLSMELLLPKTRVHSEALLRARTAPYLCKVKRNDEDTVECEVISACGYLDEDGVSCILHDRTLPNGQRAKPSLCYEWPKLGEDETGHSGCRLL